MKDYLPGTEIIPGWEVVRLIGGGGFGRVYEAKKTGSGVGGDYHSAIKVISVPHSEDDVEAYRENGYDEESITTIFRNQVDDFSAEFALMSELKGTANIVSYEDHLVVPHDDGLGWDVIIRMELLTSLPARLKEAGMTEREVVSLGIDLCTALELCSRMHILHRDIKPQNVFLNKFGSFKLGDFGIARMQDHKTRSSVTGTPDYMAPEVYLNRPYDDKIDQYSLGLMMYWLLNERRLPFLPLPPAIETARERDEAFSRRIDGEPVPAPKNGSEALKAIVLRACNADPEKRFSSPAAMKNALCALGEVPEKTVLVPIGKKPVKERIPETGSETIGAFSSLQPKADVKTERFEEEDSGQETIGAFSSLQPKADVKTESFEEEDSGQETIGAFSSLQPKADVKTERFEEEDSGQETIGAFAPVIPVKEPERKEPEPEPDTIPAPGPAESGNHPVQPAPPVPDKKPEAAPEKQPVPVSRKGDGKAEPAGTGEKKKKNLLIPALIGAAAAIGIVLLLLLSRGCGKDEPPAERSVSGISIVSVPAKADYYVGEAIDLTGLTLNVRYDDGSEETAASGFSYEPTELIDIGTQKITVTYEGKTVTFNVVVRTAELKEIQVLSLPSKTEYFVGETVDPSGLTLKTIFENGETSTAGEGYSLEGAELTEAGTKTVTVIFGGKSTFFEVNVSESAVQSVSLKSMPTKTEYFVGETVDPAGLTLEVNYESGRIETVESGYTLDVTELTEAGAQTVTVAYGGKATSFTVDVMEDEVSSLSLFSEPDRTTYYINERLDKTGLSLELNYRSGRTETVPGDSLNDCFNHTGFVPESCVYDFQTPGTKTVEVCHRGLSATFQVNVLDGTLSFLSNGDGTCRVSGAGSLQNANRIVIPSTHNGETVTSIEERAFEGNKNLNEIVFPVSTLTAIGPYSFNRCVNLKSVEIPGSVKMIGSGAFNDTDLKNVRINEGVEFIGFAAFAGTDGASFEVPNSVSTIEPSAFPAKASFAIMFSNPKYTIGGRCLVSRDGMLIRAFDGTSEKDFDDPLIPTDGSIKVIYEYAFAGVRYTKLVIPEGVTEIQYGGFMSALELTDVTIPGSVRVLGESAFSDCRMLRNIYFGGTKAEWNILTQSGKVFGYCPAVTVHCTDGDISVPSTY